jgi:hypothetical protein
MLFRSTHMGTAITLLDRDIKAHKEENGEKDRRVKEIPT